MMSAMAYVWSLMGLVTIIRGFLPPEFTLFMKLWTKKLMKKLWGSDPYCRFHIDELDSKRHTNNLYRVVEMHLRAKHLIEDADDLHLSQEESAKKISFTLAGEALDHLLCSMVTLYPDADESSHDSTNPELASKTKPSCFV